mmetsp:Transcript_34774/g.78606  ORF Transcript_34774/g.78606 Transcript_34774/m.78606 type:complete len:294 (-) Transcript_34774:231-1112(-)
MHPALGPPARPPAALGTPSRLEHRLVGPPPRRRQVRHHPVRVGGLAAPEKRVASFSRVAPAKRGGLLAEADRRVRPQSPLVLPRLPSARASAGGSLTWARGGGGGGGGCCGAVHDAKLGGGEERRRGGPGGVAVRGGELGEFGQPPPHVGAVRIARLGRVHRVHHKDPLVEPGAAAVLPHEAVDGHIRVDQSVVKPGRAVPPVQPKVLHQKRRHHVTHVVGHPPPGPELPHRCVHQWKPRQPQLPRPQRPAGGRRHRATFGRAAGRAAGRGAWRRRKRCFKPSGRGGCGGRGV